jgi:DnaD/phage-associated family protein
MDGWIKLHRKLLDNPIFQNEKLLKVFIWCLLKASHKEHETMVGLQTVTLKPGQFVYGRTKASEFLKIKPSTLNDCMEALKFREIIDIKTNNKYSLVTVVNWELYQSDEIESDNKATTKRQQSDTNKNDKNDKNIEEDDRAREGKIFEFYQKNIGLITPHQSETISQYLNDGIEPDLIIEVIKESLGKGDKWSWIKKVLNNCLEQNIKTLPQFEAKKLERSKPPPGSTRAEKKQDAVDRAKEIALKRLRDEGVITDDTS